jgi:hypothetical protein
MNRHNNVNENVFLKNTNYNVNDNDKYAKSRKVEVIADNLLEKLNLDVGSRSFMLKAAWKLPEATLWNHVEQARKGKNPVGLFIFLCKRDGV